AGKIPSRRRVATWPCNRFFPRPSVAARHGASWQEGGRGEEEILRSAFSRSFSEGVWCKCPAVVRDWQARGPSLRAMIVPHPMRGVIGLAGELRHVGIRPRVAAGEDSDGAAGAKTNDCTASWKSPTLITSAILRANVEESRFFAGYCGT